MTQVKFRNNDCCLPTDRGFIFNPQTSNPFDHFFSPFHGLGKAIESDWLPAVNISETKTDFSISMSTPGLSREDVKIEVENELLTVSGKREFEKKDETENYSRMEISSGSFRRSFTLPKGILVDKISAEMKNGILTISLPKQDPEKLKSSREVKIS